MMENADAVSGTWISPSGSILEINVKGAEITGNFTYSQGNLTTTIHGSISTEPGTGSRPLSFSTHWPGGAGLPPSVTSYTGQYQQLPSGEFHITTVYLYSLGTAPADNFKAISVGADSFTRKL